MPAFQPSRKPAPQIWLMTDPRIDGRLLAAIRKMPSGSGVIFRHYHLAEFERRELYREVRRLCALRGHMLFLAGDERTALRWKADGFHGRMAGMSRLWHSAPVHGVREIAEAKRHRATILFLSPARATQSHPGARPLGIMHFRRLAQLCQPLPVIALGGMNPREAAKWSRNLVHGWAGIDAFAG